MRPIALLLLLLACAPEEGALPEGDADAGEAVFTSNCSSCHGADAEGGFGPSLVGVAEDYADDELAEIVREGTGDDMPAFADILDDQELADVIAFLGTL